MKAHDQRGTMEKQIGQFTNEFLSYWGKYFRLML